jgi:hypothetical protein
MKKYILCVLLSFTLFGSSAAVAASPEPTSAKCIKFKKDVISDESKIKQLYRRYEPAEGKKGASYSKTKFKSYYSMLIAYNEFAIKAYKNMKKNPKCFTDDQFDSVEDYYDEQLSFSKSISEDKILKGVFPSFENMSVYGGRL